jgi:hypothetical protein
MPAQESFEGPVVVLHGESIQQVGIRPVLFRLSGGDPVDVAKNIGSLAVRHEFDSVAPLAPLLVSSRSNLIYPYRRKLLAQPCAT